MFWNTFYKLCEKNHTKPNTIAKEIGISSATCTKWKNGAIPNGETLLKLAERFNCSVDYLLGRTDEPNLITTKSKVIAKDDEELLNLINNLPLVERAKIILALDEMKNKES
jgi:transcriptional regulator with XRE-family HTH domain